MFRGEKLFGRKGLPEGSPMATEAPVATPTASQADAAPMPMPMPTPMPTPISGDPTETVTLTQGMPDDDYQDKLRTFIGPNADVYLDLKQRMQTSKRARKYCWVGFFFPMVWLFYRKMFIEGIAIFLIPAAIIFLFPKLDSINIAFGVLVLMMGTSYYLGRAEAKVKTIIDMGLPPEDERALLEKTGGVSKIGAGFATAFMIALIVVVIMAASLESQV